MALSGRPLTANGCRFKGIAALALTIRLSIGLQSADAIIRRSSSRMFCRLQTWAPCRIEGSRADRCSAPGLDVLSVHAVASVAGARCYSRCPYCCGRRCRNGDCCCCYCFRRLCIPLRTHPLLLPLMHPAIIAMFLGMGAPQFNLMILNGVGMPVESFVSRGSHLPTNANKLRRLGR